MKKYSILLFVLIALIASCSKDKINNTADKVGISKVTFFPILTMKGDNVIAVQNGASFTDPGVTAKAGETVVPVTTLGTVNTSQNGVYAITYSAVNSDGFSASLVRTIAVYTTDADAASHDLSGSYLREATGVLSYWTKLAPGVYLVANPGGAVSGAGLTVIAFNSSGYIVSVPDQRSSDGNTSSASSITFTNGNPAKYSWVFNNPGYGTSLRKFVKQ